MILTNRQRQLPPAELLHNLRTNKGWDLSEASRQLKISDTHISDMEGGRHITFKMATKLAAGFAIYKKGKPEYSVFFE